MRELAETLVRPLDLARTAFRLMDPDIRFETFVADGDRLVPRQGYRAGINPNDVARLDPALGNTPLTDAVAGIPDFSSTRVRVVKETA